MATVVSDLPHVSVCIPAYRQPAYVVRLLESIGHQSYRDFEIVITDDSPDSSVASLVDKHVGDQKCIYTRNPQRLGSPGNWNAALRLARGKWIKMMHHDDWFSSAESLEKFVAAAESSDGNPFVFSASNACNSSEEKEYTFWPPSNAEVLLSKPAQVLSFRNLIGAPSATMFARDKNFEFDPNLIWLVDIDAYIRILSCARPVFIREPLVNVSLAHGSQLTATIIQNRPLMIAENVYVLRKFRVINRPMAHTFLRTELPKLSCFELYSLFLNPLVGNSALRLVRSYFAGLFGRLISMLMRGKSTK